MIVLTNRTVTPGNIYEYCRDLLPAGDIDHHASDLYVKITPDSKAIIEALNNKVLLKTFVDNIEHVLWYELPFCYTPAFRTHERY